MNTKLKCVAIDDEPVALDIIRDYIEKVPFLTLVKSYRDSLKALEYLQNHKVDLLFLDINMPGLTGIQFLKALPAQPLVIFTTAYSQYAVESYEYDAVDYLLKPIEFDRFLKAANKVFDQFQLKMGGKFETHAEPKTQAKAQKDFVLIKSGTDLYNLKTDEILYIEGAGNYVLFVTLDNKIMSLVTMNDVLRMLPLDMFYRIHKSFIINLHQVNVIENEQVKIKNKMIPIGETFKKGFIKAIKST
jgi:DNA-binding LytR/AlgR family response regulator